MYCLLTLCAAVLVVSGIHGLSDEPPSKQSDDAKFITADTTTGKVRGEVVSNTDGVFATFKGIPFAKPPTGNLRFQPPAVPDKWNGTRDALHFSNRCAQPSYPEWTFQAEDPVTYGEDCLYLNVYVPVDNSSMTSLPMTSLPVMVWIHGGAYIIGSGSQYPGTPLAARGVVLVTINYRLDLFGFLSTEDDVMPGNYGMLDQVAALKWVQSNIGNFAGDPNMVTIFGESAGSSSVSLLMLSPLSKGLFHRAIMESGSSIAPWATQHPANVVSPGMVARLVGAGAGCKDLTNSSNLKICLGQIDTYTLLNVSKSVMTAVATGMIYLPRVEAVSGFLPDLPINILARGDFHHVDTIRGFNGHEQYISYYETLSSLDDVRKVFVAYEPQFNKLNENMILKLAEATYFQNVSPSEDDVWAKRLVEVSDEIYYVGAGLMELASVVSMSSERSHYLYEFRYRPSFQKMKKYPDWVTSVHGDELSFVFGENAFTVHNGSPPDADDAYVSSQVIDMWTNFAKTGVPSSTMSPTWKAYSPTSQNYLDITRNSTLKTWSRSQALPFYKKIVQIMDNAMNSANNNDIVG